MIRAIVIDDEHSSYGVIEYLISSLNIPLQLIGYFSSGESGWHAIKNLKPQLIFLDIQMPRMNGIDIMQKIQTEYGEKVDIVVITAYNYFEYAQAALRLGAKDILLKPIERDQFSQTIERVIGFKFTDNTLLNQIVEYMNHNYNEEIYLKDCAEKFDPSPQHISRLFKKYFETSFIKYLNEIRINEAKRLFDIGLLSIKEVAFQIGYNNLNYFYKNFKNHIGQTPKEYIVKNREKL